MSVTIPGSNAWRWPGLAIFWVLTASVLLAACSSGGDDAPETSPRFILTAAGVLSERSGASDRKILEYDDGSFLFDPALSPNGRQIAFTRQPPARIDASGGIEFGADLYVIDRGGGSPRLVLAHSRIGEMIRNPDWLNDNELLINVRGRGAGGLPDFRIETLDLTSGARRRIVESAVELAIAPDGRRLAYVFVDAAQREHLTVADLQTGQSRAISPGDSALVLLTSIVWSPDGSQIAFAAADPTTGAAPPPAGPVRSLAARHPSLQDLWLVQPDGSNFRRLAELAESQPSLAWSADGKAIYAVGGSSFRRVDTLTGAVEVIGAGIPFGQIRRIDR